MRDVYTSRERFRRVLAYAETRVVEPLLREWKAFRWRIRRNTGTTRHGNDFVRVFCARATRRLWRRRFAARDGVDRARSGRRLDELVVCAWRELSERTRRESRRRAATKSLDLFAETRTFRRRARARARAGDGGRGRLRRPRRGVRRGAGAVRWGARALRRAGGARAGRGRRARGGASPRRTGRRAGGRRGHSLRRRRRRPPAWSGGGGGASRCTAGGRAGNAAMLARWMRRRPRACAVCRRARGACGSPRTWPCPPRRTRRRRRRRRGASATATTGTARRATEESIRRRAPPWRLFGGFRGDDSRVETLIETIRSWLKRVFHETLRRARWRERFATSPSSDLLFPRGGRSGDTRGGGGGERR